ncbi:MAG: glycine--tRNA ligase subunit beta, partial [Thermodesulfobacteriota bacterium]
EKTEVAEAIYEHYLPGFAGDRLPSSPVGDIVSMADRLDTIVGCFGVGLVPTGTADPFGLRRHALGIIRIILEKKYSLSLRQLIEESGNLLKQKMERSFVEVKKEVLDFFRARYQNLFLDRGYPLDVLEAVFSVSFDDLLDVRRRIDALNRARNLEDIKSIVIAFKRAMNILKAVPSEKKMSPTASGRKFRLITIEPHPEVGATQKKGIDPSLFSEPAEHNLYKSFQEVEAAVKPLLRDGFYDGSIDEMTKMRGPIDDFFNGVMVMVEDEAVRNNRLALLDEIGQLFLKVADFSKLA